MDDIQTSFSYKLELLDSRPRYTTTTIGTMVSILFISFLQIFECEYLFFYILSLSTDVFENIDFDDDLEEILEAICKCLYFCCMV